VAAELHHFVRPEVHPKLSAFCTELTGITQAQVDDGMLLRDCLEQAEKFIAKYTDLGTCAFLTCGHWDLKHLKTQAERLGIKLPSIFRKWINVKVSFNEFVGKAANERQSGMAGMLKELKLPLIGHHHSGIDDARNIARIAIELLNRKHSLKINGSY